MKRIAAWIGPQLNRLRALKRALGGTSASEARALNPSLRRFGPERFGHSRGSLGAVRSRRYLGTELSESVENVSVPNAELAAILTNATLETRDRIYGEIDQACACLPDDARLLDDLERAIDDVRDPATQAELRRLLAELDDYRDDVRSTLDRISVPDSLDPVRVVAKDLASGFL
jgi:hypothetical protein